MTLYEKVQKAVRNPFFWQKKRLKWNIDKGLFYLDPPVETDQDGLEMPPGPDYKTEILDTPYMSNTTFIFRCDNCA